MNTKHIDCISFPTNLFWGLKKRKCVPVLGMECELNLETILYQREDRNKYLLDLHIVVFVISPPL
jgi:hypothetical protein